MTVAKHALVIVQAPGSRALRIVVAEPLEVGTDCDGLIIKDPALSPRHLLLDVGPASGTVEITDLNSPNGTFVDGEKLTGSHVLSPGQVAKIGDSTITVAPRFEMAGVVQIDSSRTVIDVGEASISIERMAGAATGLMPAASRESGTLTIVFSGIENSSSMAATMGDTKWKQQLERHGERVERHVKAQRGRIVKNQGDGFMLTFQSARQAILASIGMQKELVEDPDLKMGIGMHTGEGLMDRQGDIFGPHVNKAARVGAIARGGQIVVSDLVQRITTTRGDLRFGQPFQAVLKGIAEPAIIYEVLWRGEPN